MSFRLLKILIIQFIVINLSVAQEQESLIKTISSAEYSPSRSGILTRQIALDQKKSIFQKLDKQERMIKYDQLDPTTKKIYKSYHYFEFKEKLATKIEIYDDQNEKIEYETRILNSENEIKEIYTYSNSDELLGIQIYHYDVNLNLSLRIDSSFKYNRTLKWEYKYNNKNEVSERRAYDKDGNLRDTRMYKYDSNGNENESTLTRANGDYTLFKSNYNSYGDLIDNIWYNQDGKITNHTKLEYEYDEYGNWITKKRLRDGELNYIWEREIVYY